MDKVEVVPEDRLLVSTIIQYERCGNVHRAFEAAARHRINSSRPVGDGEAVRLARALDNVGGLEPDDEVLLTEVSAFLRALPTTPSATAATAATAVDVEAKARELLGYAVLRRNPALSACIRGGTQFSSTGVDINDALRAIIAALHAGEANHG